jgi:hypothetical protein
VVVPAGAREPVPEVLEQVAEPALARVQDRDTAAAQVRDMAVSATATRYRALPRGTRCKRLSQTRTRAAGIMAPQVSVRDTQCKQRFRIHLTVAAKKARRASFRVDSGNNSAACLKSRQAALLQPREG